MGLIGRVWAEIGGNADGLKKAAQEGKDALKSIGNEAQSASKQSASALGGLGTQAALIIGGIIAVLDAGKKVYQYAEEGAKIISLEQASVKLAATYDTNMTKIVNAVKVASFNTITEYDAMKAANLSMTMGVSTNAETIANLMEIATERGRAFGKTTTEAFETIVTGIGRQSSKKLDDLGFSIRGASSAQEYLNLVLQQGNAELKKQGGLSIDISTPYQRAAAKISEAWQNIKKSAAYGVLDLVASKDEIISINEQRASVALLTGDYEEYINARKGVAISMGDLTTWQAMTRAQFENAQAIHGQASALGMLGDASANTEIQLSVSQSTVMDSIDTYGDFTSMLEDAWKQSDLLSAAIRAMPSYKLIVIEIETRTRGMAAESARLYGQYFDYLNKKNAGGMHGGSFVGLQHGGVVPPGFSNDGMPVWVSSGEKLDVTPAGNKSVENEQLAGMISELMYAIRGLPRDIRDAVQMVV